MTTNTDLTAPAAESAARRKAARRALVTGNGRGVYITQKEAAEVLGLTDRTVRNMIADGRLRAYQLGPRVIRLRLDEIQPALKPIGGAA